MPSVSAVQITQLPKPIHAVFKGRIGPGQHMGQAPKNVRVLCEGEMRSGWMEYEFEIDAVTGAILDWDADWD